MVKNNFFAGQPIFTQLLSLVPKRLVEQLGRSNNCDRYCKRFMTYDHLVTMLYAGFFQCTSLRELTTGLQANTTRLQHLGLKHTPRRSTLSDANKRRPALFFEKLYHSLYQKYFSLPDSCSESDRLFIIDSTTISLFTSIMHGAGMSKLNGKRKGGVKAHMMVDAQHNIPAFINITEAKHNDLIFLKNVVVPPNSTVVMDKAYSKYGQFKKWNKQNIRWVTRLKADASIKHIVNIPLSEESYDLGVRNDRLVELGRPSNQRVTPLIKARIVEFFDVEKQRTFHFITNDITCNPETIAGLYKKRWQIETLFKRIKQRYPLKYFLGDNQNAIKIQIWAALICDLLVRIIQKQVNLIRKTPSSYACIASMIKHHLMTYILLVKFLINPERALLDYKPPDPQLKLFTGGLFF